MDGAGQQVWKTLHQRAAKGEALMPEEQAIYEAGCAEMDAEEEEALRHSGIAHLRQMRVQIAEAEAEQERLLLLKAEMKARIAALESQLDADTRQMLGIGN